jgi:hypothetical protein
LGAGSALGGFDSRCCSLIWHGMIKSILPIFIRFLYFYLDTALRVLELCIVLLYLVLYFWIPRTRLFLSGFSIYVWFMIVITNVSIKISSWCFFAKSSVLSTLSIFQRAEESARP